MKIRCLLVDDEPPALKVMQTYLSNISGMEVVALCKNAFEALDVIHEKTIDLIFLDIKMPKLLGIDFLRSLSNPPKVIFVTAHRDYAIEGYNLDVIDYLVKPVSFERFLKAISKVKKIMGQDIVSTVNEYKANPEAFVYLKVDKNMQKILIDQILYIESWKDYVKVFSDVKKYVLVKQSISSMENLLSNYKFLRVHRSFIVSMNKISGYNNLSLQIDHIEIPIGRLYKQKVMDTINSV